MLGRALLEQGRLDESEQALAASEGAFEQLSSRSHRAAAWTAQAELSIRRGDKDTALEAVPPRDRGPPGLQLLMTETTRTVLLAVLALVGVAVAGAGAGPDNHGGSSPRRSSRRTEATVPEGMTVVFVPPAGDGFSDGGDGPGGLDVGHSEPLPDGFSDGGDVPEGFVAVVALSPGDEFWRDGRVPEGLIPVLALDPPDGFSDGGDLPKGTVRCSPR